MLCHLNPGFRTDDFVSLTWRPWHVEIDQIQDIETRQTGTRQGLETRQTGTRQGLEVSQTGTKRQAGTNQDLHIKQQTRKEGRGENNFHCDVPAVEMSGLMPKRDFASKTTSATGEWSIVPPFLHFLPPEETAWHLRVLAVAQEESLVWPLTWTSSRTQHRQVIASHSLLQPPLPKFPVPSPFPFQSLRHELATRLNILVIPPPHPLSPQAAHVQLDAGQRDVQT